MPDHRLLQKLFFGQLKSCPRSSFNDVAVCDCQLCCVAKSYKDPQAALEGQDLPRKYLAHHELEIVIVSLSLSLLLLLLLFYFFKFYLLLLL